MKQATIIYCGLTLRCTFHYEKGAPATYDDPGYGAELSLESAHVGGAPNTITGERNAGEVDLMPLLSEHPAALEAVEELLLAAMEGDGE